MIILVLLVHAVLAAIFPIGRIASQAAAPLFFTAVRMLLGGAAILVYRGVQLPGLFVRLRGLASITMAFAATGIFLTNAPEFWALKYLPAAKASFIYSLSPFAAALCSYFLFDEYITLRKMLGMAIGLVGFSIMIIHHAPGEVVQFSIGVLSAAEGALVVAAISSALGWILLRRAVKGKQSDALIEVLGASMVIGGGFCLISSFLLESWDPIPIFDTVTFVYCLFAATLCSNGIGYPLYTELLKTYTATFLSFAGFIEPLCAALYGWFLIGEIVTINFLLASILVFIGLYIFYMEELRQGYITTK